MSYESGKRSVDPETAPQEFFHQLRNVSRGVGNTIRKRRYNNLYSYPLAINQPHSTSLQSKPPTQPKSMEQNTPIPENVKSLFHSPEELENFIENLTPDEKSIMWEGDPQKINSLRTTIQRDVDNTAKELAIED